MCVYGAGVVGFVIESMIKVEVCEERVCLCKQVGLIIEVGKFVCRMVVGVCRVCYRRSWCTCEEV